jgi:hypothetical protein
MGFKKFRFSYASLVASHDYFSVWLTPPNTKPATTPIQNPTHKNGIMTGAKPFIVAT